MTEHEIRRWAFWLQVNGWPNQTPEVFQDSEGRWGITINGLGPLYYLWEWPMFQESLKSGRPWGSPYPTVKR